MKNWSLKVKVGAYSACLTVVILVVSALVIGPVVYYQQLRQLDRGLAEDAALLYRDLKNFRGAPVNPRRMLSARLIPDSLKENFLVVNGPEGQEIYRSPKLRGFLPTENALGEKTVSWEGENYRVGVYRQGPYTIGLGRSLETIEGFQAALRKGFFVSLPLIALGVFVGGIWLGRRAVAPVALLTDAAERISAESPEKRLPVPSTRDEIARLSEVLNESFGRMQGSYEAARRFSADASHQLKTPVSILRMGLNDLRACGYLKEEEKAEVESLLQQTRRLSGLIEDLLLLAQVDAQRLKLESDEVELIDLVALAWDDLEVLVDGREFLLEKEFPESVMVEADRRRVALVLQNLVENAAKYSLASGRIRVAVGVQEKFASVRVGNSGNGIPEQDRERIFERFYRGSREGEGVRGQGLGLNIARELARAQGGDLLLLESEEGWTEFELRLPLAQF